MAWTSSATAAVGAATTIKRSYSSLHATAPDGAAAAAALADTADKRRAAEAAAAAAAAAGFYWSTADVAAAAKAPSVRLDADFADSVPDDDAFIGDMGIKALKGFIEKAGLSHADW